MATNYLKMSEVTLAIVRFSGWKFVLYTVASNLGMRGINVFLFR